MGEAGKGGEGVAGSARQAATLQRIVELQLEHGDLDAVIEQLAVQGPHDEIRLRRLKKRKLFIKDTILRLQMSLVPDIPA
jgi:hypothetical protein